MNASDYIIEPLLAVIPLNIILTVYVRRVYAGAEHKDKKFLRLNYAVTLGLLVDVVYQAALSGRLSFIPQIMLIMLYLRQITFAFMCFMFTEYVLLDEGEALDKRLYFLRRALLVFFYYVEMVTYFAGTNARIEDGNIIYGLGRVLFSFLFPLAFAAFAAAGVWLQRARQGKERLRVLLIVLLISVCYYVIRYFFFTRILIDCLIAACDVYLLFFAIETPAYAQMEQALAELQTARAEAEEAENKAKKADADMGVFLSNISHEIRTPLTTILGMNETILRRAEEGSVFEHARDIESAGNTLVQIINDILDFSKIESGELELAIRDYHLGQVLRDVDNMIRIRAGQKGLGYISQIDHSLPEELLGDRIRVQQVMVNLLNNGVKYTKKGHVKLQISGERGNDPSYLTLHITVSDTGIGIREEDIPKLFKNFQRIDMEQTHGIEGTGLGLAITGRLIDLMDGTVDVQSVYGKGTTFHVTLPQRVTGTKTLRDFEEEDTHAAAKKKHVFTAPDAQVLVVDDNQMNRIVLKSLLSETKVQVDMADSGKAALTLCQKKRYDLILMDYMMPLMDGKETLQRLRAMEGAPSKDAKVIVCTANAVVGVRAELLAAGFDDFLSKPVNSDELKEMLEKYIGGKEETAG